MGKINVLSFAVANLIAAGEVVDRPASAVKELLENAIDAGATRITVEIQNGGVSFLRVADNGCGMEADDLPVAVRRHATSKIKTAEDLDGIETLGFRGEALAAIASVSDMRIISKTAEAELGAMLEVRAGNIMSLTERACATGTTIIVENLFANVPARRKFLKRDVTEASAVSVWVEKIALAEPGIAIKMIVDGHVKFETEGNGDLKSAVYAIYGREFAGKLIAVNSELDGVAVKGFIGRSDNFKANRNMQNFFINGRYIKSKTACAALEQAYSSYIPSEKFPCCILNIRVNPRAVDVNVHPAKLEVKFSNEKPIFDAVYYTVRTALEQDVTRPALTFSKPQATPAANAFVPVAERRPSYENVQMALFKQKPPEPSGTSLKAVVGEDKPKNTEPAASYAAEDNTVTPAQKTSELSTPSEFPTPNTFPTPSESMDTAEEPLSPELLKKADRICKEEIEANLAAATAEPLSTTELSPPHYRILGEAFHSYVFVESEGRLLIIDKHAAHERVLFEELRARMKDAESASQLLMLPIEVMLTTDERQTIESYRAELEAVGFRFTVKRHSAEIDAIPTGISVDAVCDMFIVIADHILNATGTVRVSRDMIFEKALYQASCKAAIKAGREYPEGHVAWLVEKLMQLPDITFCPHGRPIAIEMTKTSLDHQFERT